MNGIKGKKGYKQAYKPLYEVVFLAKNRWSFYSKFKFFVTIIVTIVSLELIQGDCRHNTVW